MNIARRALFQSLKMRAHRKISSESNTVVIEAEIHAENTDAQHMVHFEEAQDFSDAGSLITQAPQSQSIHATINALSTWVSAIQPRESWYLAGWIGDSPIDFLVDPGAVVSAISLHWGSANHSPHRQWQNSFTCGERYMRSLRHSGETIFRENKSNTPTTLLSSHGERTFSNQALWRECSFDLEKTNFSQKLNKNDFSMN